MSNPEQVFKKILADIMKDVMSMSADVIKKSTLFLNDDDDNPKSVDESATKVNTLLKRINSNVNTFLSTYETASINYKKSLEAQKSTNIPRKKLSLSLRRNGQTPSTDVEVANSEDETTSRKSPEKPMLNGIIDTDSESDGEKTIMNFDANVSQADFTDDEGPKDDKSQGENTVTEAANHEAGSNLDEEEEDEGRAEEEAKDSSQDQIDLDNHELLNLLTEAIGESPPESGSEADVALKHLASEASDNDSDESMASLSEDEDWQPSDESCSNSDSELNLSDLENPIEDEIAMKDCFVKMNKIDQLSTNEIDRLCNIENINKRKCLTALKALRKKRRKRIRVISSCSSSSSSSALSSIGSSTPDNLETQIDNQNCSRNEDISVLADVLIDKLNDTNEIELSSESSTDTESPKTNKIKKQKDETNAGIEVTLDKEAKEDQNKKTGSWRKELFFGTSSESSEDELILVENEEIEDSKESLKLRLENNGESMVITDSDSGDDDVAFVDESVDDGLNRGRRKIRSILNDNELCELTQKAKTEEDERILRLQEHSRTLESIQSQRDDLVLDVDVKTGVPIITVDYNLTQILKPHQREGVKFMWEACYETVQVLKKKPGTGCILAHCMGLGKTLQIITLVHTLFTHPSTQTKYVLIICPLSTVSNWKNEFSKTFQKLRNPSEINRYFLIKGELNEKTKLVKKWRETGGVLVMGYETFQILTNEKLSPKITPIEKQETLEALINPGPDLIICDEGHQLKNDKALRTKALMKVKTKRRIVLTGTPLQNNLKEYYYMVEFVKPHILGTYVEYRNRFATPIQNGQYHDSTPDDIKLSKKRTHVLTKLLKKTIHRAEASILTSYLPPIIDYTIFIKLTKPQMLLYAKYIDMVKKQGQDLTKGFLNDVMMLSLNNLHPYTIQLYYNKLKLTKRKKRDSGDPEIANEVDHITPDWYQNLFMPDVATNINQSSKLKLIFDILDECVRLNEKVLIFAQRLIELDVIENFLKICGTKHYRVWVKNMDYYRMDGSTPVESRDKLCKNFNINANIKAFLLTHRVGGLGLNLTGANRVILIGSNHNPSLDAQSMYRVYRFGQHKNCYIYRLISLATMEEKIYHRCVVKLHLSGTVVDKLHFIRRYTANDLQEMYSVNFTEYIKKRPIPAVPTDKVLATVWQNIEDIFKYHPHNSLLENRPEEELTDEDKKLAWEEFNNMEEAAKHVPVHNLIPLIPINRFEQSSGALRAQTVPLVPNPVNNSARGFYPRALLEEGIRNSQAQKHKPHIFRRAILIDPPPRGLNSHAVEAGPSSSIGLVRSEPEVRPFILPKSNVSTTGSATSSVETMRNIRANLISLLRGQAKPREEPTSGEFNYALNKVI